MARQRAGWLRCRLLATEAEEPTYTASPRITAITAHTVGGTAPMIHAEVVRLEHLEQSQEPGALELVSQLALRWCRRHVGIGA